MKPVGKNSCKHLLSKLSIAVGQRFSSGNSISSTNKTDRYNITEILLKVALNTIIPCNLATSSAVVNNYK
jgi:hypothetical protein